MVSQTEYGEIITEEWTKGGDIYTKRCMNFIKSDNSVENGFLYDGSQWKKLSEVEPEGVKGNFWVDVLVSSQTSTGIGDGISPEDLVSVFPNPVVNGRFYYKTDRKDLKYIEIFSVNGRRVLLHQVSQGDVPQVDIPGVSPGIYLAKFVFSDMAVTRKLLVK